VASNLRGGALTTRPTSTEVASPTPRLPIWAVFLKRRGGYPAWDFWVRCLKSGNGV